MQNYFVDLKRWLEQVELGIRSSPSTDRLKTELEVSPGVGADVSYRPSTLSLARFEEIADEVPEELLPFHRTYAKRQLHPQLSCALPLLTGLITSLWATRGITKWSI